MTSSLHRDLKALQQAHGINDTWVERLLSGDATPSEWVEGVASLLCRSDVALEAAYRFRPLLLHALGRILAARANEQISELDSMMALMRVAPHFAHTRGWLVDAVLLGARAACPSLPSLLDQAQADPGALLALARALVRLVQLEPSARDAFQWGAWFTLLEHANAHVRWTAALGCVHVFGISDAARSRLVSRALASFAQGDPAAVAALEADCQLAWDVYCDHSPLERACLWREASSSEETGDSHGDAGTDAAWLEALGDPPGHVRVCASVVLPRKEPSHGSQGPTASHGARRALVMTPTVQRNLESAALALCLGRPLLLEGPPGSGKSALVDDLAHRTGHDRDMIRIHLDDQTDSKSLLGAYVCTHVPGEFVWQAGPLTQAVAQGRWLLFEDVDMAPPEVLAALVPLMESRELQLPQRGQTLRAAPGFQLLASITSAPLGLGHGSSGGAYASSQGVKDLLGGLFAYVAVEPPPVDEIARILAGRFPDLASLAPLALDSLRLAQIAFSQCPWPSAADPSGAGDLAAFLEASGVRPSDASLHTGRHLSIRDLIKWATRLRTVHAAVLATTSTAVHAAIAQGRGSDAAALPMTLREACWVEAADVFCAHVPNEDARGRLLRAFCRLWALPPDATTLNHESQHRPQLQPTAADLHVGRATLHAVVSREEKGLQGLAAAVGDHKPSTSSSSFARTAHTMRMMERLAVALQQNEPALLVGETGTGKTTLAQEIAKNCGAKLTVLNLSQQTDSSDLLGGFRPVDAKDSLLPLLPRFSTLVRWTWPKGANDEFLARITQMAEKKRWGQLVKAMLGAAEKVEREWTSSLASTSAPSESERAAGDKRKSPDASAVPAAKKKKTSKTKGITAEVLGEWNKFAAEVRIAERAAAVSEDGFAFAFVEGALIRAVREGTWLLLDEINLAPAEVLERIAGLLEAAEGAEGGGSITLAERGDLVPVPRSPHFRLLAAMNPATDAGKRDLPAAVRNRLTEIYVPEPSTREDLRTLVRSYLDGLGSTPPLDPVVDFYQTAKKEAEAGALADGAGLKPSYSLRTLCRALEYVRTAAPVYGTDRALFDGFSMAFLTQLDGAGEARMGAVMRKVLLGASRAGGTLEQALSRTPAAPSADRHVLFDSFWVEKGDHPLPSGGADDDGGGRTFVLTPSVRTHLKNLARAVVMRKYPILLQGPTSSGKTSLVGYLAAQTGHAFVRINNHEQTDLQEYLGSYVADESGRLVFREGLLVQAVRHGHWLVLDELNLAPTEVLEALNRLLDDNRELFVPELQEVVKPHPHFALFATQNPPGAYAGRKQLSRAFRSRFLELHIDDIPDEELATILERRCAIAPSYAQKMIEVMRELQRRRQMTNVFAGKAGFITPRDLFRWAERGAVGYQQLAEDGFCILGERLRSPEERETVREVLEKVLKARVDPEDLYRREGEAPFLRLRDQLLREEAAARQEGRVLDDSVSSLAASLRGLVWTRSLSRLFTLVDRCLQHSEPVLLVGETGTGKTTVCQLLAFLRSQQLAVINCNQHTETADFLGGFRPTRDREKATMTAMELADQIRQDTGARPESHDLLAAHLASLEDPRGKAGPELASAVRALVAEVRALVPRPAAGTHEAAAALLALCGELEVAASRVQAPFQWADGPLVQCMRGGHLILVDEMNLAEDAVIERMNSVLEPGRSLTLAERGGDGAERIVGAAGFRFLATMNPGGDFGKKELSPALSNRFTTIWVPAMEDAHELRLILEARLAHPALRESVAPRLLAFWEFFRACPGALRAVPLSVRDLLAWVSFVNAAEPSLGAVEAFLHGAHLVLLDGLGLGVGMPEEAVRSIRRACRAFLEQSLPADIMPEAHRAAGDVRAASIAPLPGPTPEGRWGIPPFFIDAGPAAAASTSSFDLTAPTTARNAMRVLRAMQLRKAVLLEGSPGVGKTTLIAALARCAGRELIRINLSEQTDMMDLLGADLPVEGGRPGEFHWHDGPLLRAIRTGAWVLLDELNLASQSVLEGLNAVLDHRAEVFVPELGQSYKCPPSFRLFGAQNPVHEGGGRKGLPRSFLNRFTRVHVELLEDNDLALIAASLHRSVPRPTLDKMVAALAALHRAANVERSFGLQGGPWEFNLRDLLRWSTMIERLCAANASVSPEDAALHFARLLIFERLRTPEDRSKASAIFKHVWGVGLALPASMPLELGPAAVRLGLAALPRGSDASLPVLRDRLVLQHQTAPYLESAMHALSQGWMVLLLGPQSSGKTAAARTLAHLSGRDLLELSLTSGTDTSDLLGGFEQLEPARRVQDLAQEIECAVDDVISAFLAHGAESGPLSAVLARWHAVEALLRMLESAHAAEDPQSLLTALNLALDCLGAMQQAIGGLGETAGRDPLAMDESPDGTASFDAAPHLHKVHTLMQRAEALVEIEREGTGKRMAGRFEWVDGSLLRAMESGRWVLLNNANLCNPTVLDRLNPLLEPSGVLYLNECGLIKGEPRVVRPHPDFRLILAIDPRHGEVSRAMRNRGIELFLLPHPASALAIASQALADGKEVALESTAYLDDLDVTLQLDGLSSAEVRARLLAAYAKTAVAAAAAHRRAPSVRELRQCARLVQSLVQRGWGPGAATRAAWDQVIVRSEGSRDGVECARAASAIFLVDGAARPPMVRGPLPLSHLAASLEIGPLQRDSSSWPVFRDLHALLALLRSSVPSAVLEASGSSRYWELTQETWAAREALEGLRGEGESERFAASLGSSALRVFVESGLESLRLESSGRLLATALGSMAEEALAPGASPAALWKQVSAAIVAHPLTAALLASAASTSAQLRTDCLSILYAHLELSSALHAASVHAQEASTSRLASTLALSALCHMDAQERARREGEVPGAALWTFPLLSATNAMEQGLLESIGALVQENAVASIESLIGVIASLQCWTRELLLLASAPVDAFLLESFGVAWHKWKKAWMRTAAQCLSLELVAQLKAAGDALQVTADQVDRSLGIHALKTTKPLLWKHGGHPTPPPTVELCGIETKLRVTAARLVPGLTGYATLHEERAVSDAALAYVQEASQTLMEGSDPTLQARIAAALEERARAAAAVVAVDEPLRRALVEALVLLSLVSHHRASLAGMDADSAAKVLSKFESDGREMLEGLERRIADRLDAVLGSEEQWVETAIAARPNDGSEDAPEAAPRPLLFDKTKLDSAARPSTASVAPALLFAPEELVGLDERVFQMRLLALPSLQGTRALAGALASVLPASMRGVQALDPALLAALEGTIETSLKALAASPLAIAPLQQLLFAGRAGLSMPDGARDLLSAAVHEALFGWHEEVWAGHLTSDPFGAPPDPRQVATFGQELTVRAHREAVQPLYKELQGPCLGIWERLGAPVRLHQASWSVYAAAIVAQPPTSVLLRGLKLKQLRLAARQLRGAVAVVAPSVVDPEVRLVGLLAVQILAAHVSAIPSLNDRNSAVAAVEACVETLRRGSGLIAEPLRFLLGHLTAHAAPQHAIFAALSTTMLPRLVDALIGAHDGAARLLSAGAQGWMASRGALWALVGLARTHLAAPPAGRDPSGKYALLHGLLHGRLHADLASAKIARLQWTRLPGSHAQAVALALLEEEMGSVRKELRRLETKSVARPDPPQYAPLQAEIARVVESLVAVDRTLLLIARLATVPAPCTEAADQARVLVGNLGSWIARSARSHPLYRDVLQPVLLGGQELRTGLALLMAPHVAPQLEPAPGSDLEVAAGVVARLMAFPKSAPLPAGVPSLPQLASHRSLRAIGGSAGEWVQRAVQAADPIKVRAAKEAASYTARAAALHVAIRELTVRSASGLQSRHVVEETESLLAAFVAMWEEVKELEARRAAEEDELFKTKTRVTHVENEEEEEARELRTRFPTFREAFADLETADPSAVDVDLGAAPPSLAHEAAAAKESEGATAVAKDLLEGGRITADLVRCHAVVFGAAARDQAASNDAAEVDWEAFQRAYDLGVALLRAQGCCLPPWVDAAAREGHMVRTALEARRYRAASASSLTSQVVASSKVVVEAPEALVDVYQPVVEEVCLIEGPVSALRRRVRELLEEWPGNPLLAQLETIADRLLATPVSVPLKQVMTGSELLLQRSQLWEETAAKHVSIRSQLDVIGQLAQRWHRLELASWAQQLVLTRDRHARGAHRSWPHIYRLLTATDSPLSDVFQTLEHFVQTSTLGEFEARLALLTSFQGHMEAKALGDPSGALAPRWMQLAALLSNLVRYYGQFRKTVSAAIDATFLPLEKELKDFVRLAKWEDRGYYAMKKNADKAHRALTRLTLKAEAGLREPVAATLTQASRGMGFRDVQEIHDAPAREIEAERGWEVVERDILAQSKAQAKPRKAKGGKRKAAAAAPLDADEDVQMTVPMDPMLVAALEDLAAGDHDVLGDAAAELRFLPRLATLRRRLRRVLSDALRPSTAALVLAHPADTLEELCTDALEGVLELRQIKDKKSRMRKKNALLSLLKALEELGISRRRASVPATDRSVQQWFMAPAFAAEDFPCLDPEGASVLRRADAYYFLSIARLQRLWEAAKAPSKDLSGGEVMTAQRLCEHLLHLVRSQRTALRELRDRLGALEHALAAVRMVRGEGDGGSSGILGPDQVLLVRWAEEQSRMLSELAPLMRTCGAASVLCLELEDLPTLRAPLDRARGTFAAHAAALETGLTTLRELQARLGTAIAAAIVPRDVLDVVQSNALLVHKALMDCASLDTAAVPGAGAVLSALQTAWAGEEGRLALAGPAVSPTVAPPPAPVTSAADGVVAAVLLWAQDMAKALAAAQQRKKAAEDEENAFGGGAVAAAVVAANNNDADTDAMAVDGEGEGYEPPAFSTATAAPGGIPAWTEDLVAALSAQRIGQLSAAVDALAAAAADAHATTDLGPLAAALEPLLQGVMGSCRGLVGSFVALHKSTVKTAYVVTSLLSGVIQEGFCIPPDAGEGEGEGAGGQGGEFKEADGTGLGEGQGKKDVSDEIENEDQILGAEFKDKEKKEPEEPEEKQEGAPEEEKKGIEMDQDFEGALEDLSEDEHEDGEDEGEGEEEDRLDQQMGDVGDEGDVVDERMWGSEDEEAEGQEKGPDRYDKDKPVPKDESRDLELRAQDDPDQAGGPEPPQKQDPKGADDKKPPPKKDDPQHREANPHEEEDEDAEENGKVNDEQAEQDNFAKPQAPEDEFELPEDMKLDGDGEGEEDKEGGEDGAGAPEEEEAIEQRGKDEGARDDDAPETERPGDPTGPEDDAMDEDAEDKGEGEGEGEGEEGAENPLAQALDADGNPEQPPAPPPEAEDAPDKVADHGGERANQTEENEQAGPRGNPSNAPQAAVQDETRGKAAGAPPAQADAGEGLGEDAGDDQQPAFAQEDPAAQQDAAQKTQKARGGAAAASQRGAKAPLDPSARDAQPPQQAKKDSSTQDESNPFRNLGNAMEKWKAGLNVTDDAQKEEKPEKEEEGVGQRAGEEEGGGDAPEAGEYEFTGKGERGDHHALAPATEDQAEEMEGLNAREGEGKEGEETDGEDNVAPLEEADAEDDAMDDDGDAADRPAVGRAPPKWKASTKKAGMKAEETAEEGGGEGEGEGGAEGADDPMTGPDGRQGDGEEAGAGPDSMVALRLLDELALGEGEGREDEILIRAPMTDEDRAALRADLAARLAAEVQKSAGDAAAQARGRDLWSRCEALVAPLASELTEQLRLILEPTLASRLAGDYRTGKRISMRKVIAYIASQFRRDKIWLRRTRPDKRRYQVVLAIDDSRSMRENSCGPFAMEALTLLCKSLTRLEIGELGVVAFGGSGTVRYLHPLDQPFSEPLGPQLLSQLTFSQDNTVADRPMVELVEGLGVLLEEAGQRAGGQGRHESLHQLVLVLADGRFHEKESLRRAVRDLANKRGVMVAFIALDSAQNSLLDLQAVQFVGGKPVFNRYLDSFPFPFYILLKDIAALPKTLADLMRQWAQLTTSSRY